MFEFEYLNLPLQEKINNPNKYLPPEVCDELPQFITALRQGKISKADFQSGDLANKGIFKISTNTFDLYYTPGSSLKKIKIIDIKPKSLNLFRERFSISVSWDDKEVLQCIPQYDVPEKIIQAIELINQGIDDSYSLGRELGHKGKRKEYIVRHGNYAKTALSELGLIDRIQEGKALRAHVTLKGKLIAEADNSDTKKRLLIEIMLNYPPIWLIMGKVTEGEQELTDGLILETVFPLEVRDADTSFRRAKTLRRWIKWISDYSGIPIYFKGQGLQLTIPMLYAKEDPGLGTLISEDLH